MNNTNLNTTVVANSTAKKVIVAANVWRRNIISALSQLMLIWDRNEVRRAMNCMNLSDWTFKGLALYDHAKAKRDDLLKQLQKPALNKDVLGFSIIDLEYFSKYYLNLKKDNAEAEAVIVQEFRDGKSELSKDDLQKCRIEMHFDRQIMAMLIDILNTEVARRNVVAAKLREENEKSRAARDEANKKRIEELRAKEAEAEAKRSAYILKKIAEARSKRNPKYVPPVARKEFKTITSFEELAAKNAKLEEERLAAEQKKITDELIANRKKGKFVSVDVISKAQALELAGIDQKSFEAAYKAVSTTPDAPIVTLPDARVISFVKSGAAVRYLVRA